MKKLLTVLLIGTTVLTTACTKLNDTQVGVSEGRFSGEISDTVATQGIHQVLTQKITELSKRNLVLTVDTQPIVSEKVALSAFQAKVNYGIVPENAAIAYKAEKAQHITTEDGDVYLLGQYVHYVANSAIQDIVSKYKALEVNDNRTKIEQEILTAINAKLKAQGKNIYVKANEVNILKVTPPQSIMNSSLSIVTSLNQLKTKQNELETAKVETEIKRVLAENASEKYIELLQAEAEKTKSEALLEAAKKGTLNTMVIVPEKFNSLGNMK